MIGVGYSWQIYKIMYIFPKYQQTKIPEKCNAYSFIIYRISISIFLSQLVYFSDANIPSEAKSISEMRGEGLI